MFTTRSGMLCNKSQNSYCILTVVYKLLKYIMIARCCAMMKAIDEIEALQGCLANEEVILVYCLTILTA